MCVYWILGAEDLEKNLQELCDESWCYVMLCELCDESCAHGPNIKEMFTTVCRIHEAKYWEQMEAFLLSELIMAVISGKW